MAKKLLLLFLATAALMTACGDKETPDAEGELITLTFACLDHQRGQFESLAKDFQAANPDVRVHFISVDEALGRSGQGDMLALTGNRFERLAVAADTFVGYARFQPADWHFLSDLSPFVNDLSFPADDFYPGALDHFRWQGGIYGLPAEIRPLLIFYDRELFDRAGVSHPHVGWTWDDLVRAAAQLTEREDQAVQRYGFVDDWPEMTVTAMMHQHGASLWDDRTHPPRPSFDTPEAVGVLRRYSDMALRDEIMPLPPITGAGNTNLVREGKAAMWTDFATTRSIHARLIDLGLAPYPEATNAANPRTLYGFFVSAGSAHPEAAWRWLSHLSANYQPAQEGVLPGRRSVTGGLPWWQGLDEETKSVFAYALAHPSTTNDVSNAPLLLALSSVFEGGDSVEQALATAQERAQKMLLRLTEATPAAPRPVATPPPTPQEGQTVITFAPPSGADISLYRRLAARFQESHPDVWVEIAPRPEGLEELVKTRDCFSGGVPHDLSEVRQYIRNLQPLADADLNFDRADFYPQFLEGLQQDGELWGLPYEADPLMVYVNRDRLAEAGLAPPEPGWRCDDFMDAAVELSADGQYGFTTREGAYGDLIFALECLGARLYDYSAARENSAVSPLPIFDDPAVVTALGQYADLSRDRRLSPATPPAQVGWPDARVNQAQPIGVKTGQVGMWIDYPTAARYNTLLPFEVGVAPLPLRGGAGESLDTGSLASTEFQVHVYYVSPHTDVPQLCWEWLTFLSSQPQAIQLLPARRSVATSSEWQEQVEDAALPAYLATLEYANTPVLNMRMLTPWSWMGYTYPWLDEAFQATVAGQDAERALGEAQAKAEAFVACLEVAGDFTDHGQLSACARQVDPDYPLRGANR